MAVTGLTVGDEGQLPLDLPLCRAIYQACGMEWSTPRFPPLISTQ